jgi:hypothetical protein
VVVQADKVYFISGRKPYDRCGLPELCSGCNLCPCLRIDVEDMPEERSLIASCECYLTSILSLDLETASWNLVEQPSEFPSLRSTFVLSIAERIFFGGGQSLQFRAIDDDLDGFNGSDLEHTAYCLAPEITPTNPTSDVRRTATNSLYEVQLNNLSPQSLQLPSVPGTDQSRSYATTFTINGKGYVGLGYGPGTHDEEPGPILNDFYELDPSQTQDNPWKPMADFPGGPTHQAGFALLGKGYVIAGGQSEAKELWKFDPSDGETGSWELVASIPDNLSSFLPQASFQIGNMGYVYFDSRPDNFWAYIPELE